MDAAAYLKKQGWRGTGHSLDQTDRGIVRPLQISKKVDALGVGIQKYAAVSDQWWLRAYDQGLKDLGSGKESALATAKKHGVNRGGLYARFVKGTEIPGTIGQRALVKDNAVVLVDDKSKTNKIVHSKTVKEARKRKRRQSEVATDPQTTIMEQINAYVVEARRRGILPNGLKGCQQSTTRPSDKDMKAVLKLARMDTTKSTLVCDEKKTVRNLKRAALHYMERQKVSMPT